MIGETTLSVALGSDASQVGRARGLLRRALVDADAEHLVDSAVLALSEVVTNAFVHAGGDVRLDAWIGPGAVRVEVADGAAQLPSVRAYADTAGTGRGLHLVEELADRWGASPRPGGKVVWFELGADGSGSAAAPGSSVSSDGAPAHTADTVDTVRVTLRDVPVLMHLAWQEHAATLLREYLLHTLDDDFGVLDEHARASSAMSLLNAQLPVPLLPDHADALMAEALEPQVTAPEVVLRVPVEVVAHFATLDDLMRRAITASQSGHFLSPPTQPEIDEMREWICAEVSRQAAGEATATPWVARTDVRATLADQAELTATYAHLADVDEALLATDEASIIVAASPRALEVLGYERADELLGRRVIVVVPSRFHQAHIAGTTFHATNGRDNLLDVSIQVPMVRADGIEVPVVIEVRAERFDEERHVFVARFELA